MSAGLAVQAGMLVGRAASSVSLLDKAWVAYSLRDLGGWGGDVIQVTRSGDAAVSGFTPAEINDGTLLGWVVAGGGTEDGEVTTWYDQSGNGHDLTDNYAGSYPKIVTGGVLETSAGFPAVRFDSSSLAAAASHPVDRGPDYLALMVSDIDDPDPTIYGGFWSMLLDATDALFAFFSGSLALRFGDNSAVSTGNAGEAWGRHLWVAQGSGTTGTIWIDQGAALVSSSSETGLTAGPRRVMIGNSYQLNGNYRHRGPIMEFIVYNEAMESSREAIMSAMFEDYNLAV